MSKELKVYAIRDKSTGKLVRNVTSKRKTFWQNRTLALDAMNNLNNRRFYLRDGELELVTFKLVEVNEDE